MPSELTQFTRDSNPRRAGLPPVEEPLAERPIGVRLYADDDEILKAHPDRSGFIREAVRQALRPTTD
jgi:hypothetical protein